MIKSQGLRSASRFLPYIALLVYFVGMSPFVGQKMFASPFSVQVFAWVAVLPIVITSLCIVGLLGALKTWRANKHRVSVEPKYRGYLPIAGFGLMCFVAALAIGGGTGYLYAHQKFSGVVWQDRKSIEWHPEGWTGRQRMVDDLTQNVLPKLSRTETVALLGNPDETYETENGGSQIEYYLGYERGLGVDVEILWIEYDSSGRFVRWEIFNS